MNDIISFETNRLIIRDLNWDDLEFIHSIHSIPEVHKYATLDIPESLNDSKNYLEIYINQQDYNPRKEYGFCVSLIDQTPIGLIGFSNSLNKFRSAELWFKLNPAYWGNGYITEAALRLLEFCFTEMDLHRIEAGVATENLASIKTLEKIGMQREGMRRKFFLLKGSGGIIFIMQFWMRILSVRNKK